MDYPILFLMLALAVPIGALWGHSPRKAAMAGGIAALSLAVLFALTSIPIASAIAVTLLLALAGAVLWGIPAAILSLAARRSSATPWYAAWAIASYAGMLVGLLVLNVLERPERSAA